MYKEDERRNYFSILEYQLHLQIVQKPLYHKLLPIKTKYRKLLTKLPKMIANTAIATAILAALATASPTPRGIIAKRFEEGVDCTSDVVNNGKKDNLFYASDSTGAYIGCDEVNTASSGK